MRPVERQSVFPSTRWSRILPARTGDPKERAAALDALARDYASPVVAWLSAALRVPPDDALDVAQGFFAWTAESGFLAKADPTRGRFRAFVKTALRNFAADEARTRRSQRRGGGRRIESLAAGDEAAVPVADARAIEPDAALDAAWRRALIEGAIADVEQELVADGKAAQFAAFRDYFLAADAEIDYAALAARHGLSRSDVSNALQRTKARFRERLRARVIETVTDADDLKAELEWLFGRLDP